MAEPSRTATRGTQAVDRACALLALAVRAEEPPTFSDLCETSGLARSTTSRLLAALERTDLLQRDTSGAYLPGHLFALHAARHDRWQELSRIARPHLQRLRDVTGETAHLGAAQGSTVLHVAQVDSTFLLGTRDWNDTHVPDHASALGKVLLAAGRIPLADELQPCTARTITDHSALERDLRAGRRRGYAVTVDEFEVGLAAVAAPVSGRDGEVFAALGVSGPTARLEDRLENVGRLLIEQAHELSALLRRRTHKEGAA